MELSDEILTELSYVEMSTYRAKVMKSLKDDIKIPSQIAKETRIYQNHISNVLRQLKEHDLVVCLNPEVKKGRLYKLTDKGKKVAENIDTLNMTC